MRNFSLSAAIAFLTLSTAVAGAGIVGTVSITSHLMATELAQNIGSEAGPTIAPVRVPVRLQTVSEGRFTPATRTAVTFARQGNSVLRADVIAGGTVQTQGLASGTYSVIATGPDGFAAFSTVVAPTVDPAQPIISVGLVPRRDLPTVRGLIDASRNASAQPVDRSQPVSRSTYTASSRSLIRGGGFELSPDGVLRGRAVQAARENAAPAPIQNADVYFIRDNKVQSQAVSDADGLFEIKGLASGIYSLVVTGQSAFVAISVEVTPAALPLAGTPTINEVSMTTSLQDSIIVQDDIIVPEVPLICEEDWGIVEECLIEEEYLIEEELVEEEVPCCGGGFAGGSGGYGGGGGGGYGGGLGALLGGAALGAAIYAIADDDDDNRRVISPQAP